MWSFCDLYTFLTVCNKLSSTPYVVACLQNTMFILFYFCLLPDSALGFYYHKICYLLLWTVQLFIHAYYTIKSHFLWTQVYGIILKILSSKHEKKCKSKRNSTVFRQNLRNHGLRSQNTKLWPTTSENRPKMWPSKRNFLCKTCSISPFAFYFFHSISVRSKPAACKS